MKHLLAIAFFLFAFSMFAQNMVTVFGKVVDQTSKEALPFTNIYISTLQNQEVSTGITNDEGNFQFELQQGAYVLEVEFLGFKKKKIEFLK